MNVLILESHYRSRTWFDAISDIDNLYIISVVLEEKRLFLKKGFSEDRILDLNNPNLDGYNYKDCLLKLSNYEVKFKFNINKIILTDRTLRVKNYQYVAKYVCFLIDKSLDFIKCNNINITFLEPTWTHEIIICKLMEYYNIPVFAPAKDKILPNRFFFFHGYLNKDFFKRSGDSDAQYIANEISNSVLSQDNKIQYFDQYNKRNVITFRKFIVLWDIIRLAIFNTKNNNIQPSLFFSIRKKMSAMVRAKYIPLMGYMKKIDDIRQKYILITLHVQPEASIDVLGSKFSNQIEFVKQVSRTCPVDYCIAVKEHPHAFGDRKTSFYESLNNLNNVVVIDHKESSLKAIKNSELVISITGTSSLEAAIAGVPAVTAVEMFFKDLMVVPFFDPFCDSTNEIINKTKRWRDGYSKERIIKLLTNFQKHSFPGNSGDYKTDASVLSSANIKKVRAAFLEVIDAHK
jgi:hypothetical protein